MGGSKVKRQKKSRHRQLEPLISTRREDGLWRSIERDDEDLASHERGQPELVPATKNEDASDQGLTQQDHEHRRDSATTPGKENAPQEPSDPDSNAVKKESPVENDSSTSSRADILAWVSVSPPQYQHQPRDHPPQLRPAPDIPRGEPPTQDLPATRRRRGRPRKSRNAPNWNRPRRVRFSDPIPPADPGPPQLESRDTHVFVRLLKIILTAESGHPNQRQELVWNNRAKGWRLAGERSERNIGDVGELFDDISTNGSLLTVILAPTVQRGARELVEAAWDASGCIFQGLSQDLGSLAVALGEVKDMVKDPWARQFIGYSLM